MHLRLAALLAAGAVLAGCAPALSTLHPATVAAHRHVDAGMGYGLSVPVAGVGRSVSTAKDNVDRAEEGEPLDEKDRDQIIRTALGLALNPPSFGSQYRLAYGIYPGVEIDLRYALSAWRLGARWQVIGEPVQPPTLQAAKESVKLPPRLAGSVGIGVSRYVFSFGVPSWMKPVADVDDFTRYDIDVPFLVGASHDVFHVWGGPKVVASFMSAGVDVCTQIDTDADPPECTDRVVGKLNGRALYFAGQAGAAVGYKYAWIAAELTAAYVDVEATGELKAGDVDEKRKFRFGDVVIYPVLGLVLRF